MRTKLMVGLVAVLLALPVSAAADDAEYFDPPDSVEETEVLAEEVVKEDEQEEVAEVTADSEPLRASQTETLVATGADSTVLLGIALALLLTGAGVLFTLRRRATSSG